MFGKIYLALLAASTAMMAFFTYYSCSWLKSVGAPATAIAGYDYHSGYGWTALWLTTVLLLILGNVVLWASGRVWAMWITVAYFAVFSILRSFWLEPAAAEFRTANSLAADSSGIGPIFAATLIAFVALIAFLDQFMIIRLLMTTYAPVEGTVTEPDEPQANEKPTE
jgi:hypothetical protein